MKRNLSLTQQAILKQRRIKRAMKKFKKELANPQPIFADDLILSPIVTEVRHQGKIYHVYR